MSEYHVCGVLLMSRPEHAASVKQAVDGMCGTQLHANDGGRMVVTVEGSDYGRCAETITELARLHGVASSSVVYYQYR